MIELKLFTENDFYILQSSIYSEGKLVQCAEPIFSYPLTNVLSQVVLTKNYRSTKHINFDLDTLKGAYF